MVYTCSNCDSQYPKWSGRCSECGKWGTLKETAETAPKKSPLGKLALPAAPAKVLTLDQTGASNVKRHQVSGFPAAQLFPDGLVLGSLTLVTGEPGAGKSSLCLQAALAASNAADVLYVTAEESAAQVHERAARFGSAPQHFMLAEVTNLEQIVATIASKKPHLTVIDSLQMITSDSVQGEPGSLNQVRTVTATLLACARDSQSALVLVGHVTKDGAVAGPKTLEHLVDAVYYLEADRKSAYRLLRSYKNRFGETGKVLVMQLGRTGFSPVANPATIFVQNYAPKPGSVLTISLIDDQFFFVEVQSLVTKSSFGYAKRTSSGFPRSRLELLLAIMKKHLHVDLDSHDVYVNIAGGFHLNEPAMDSAVVLSVLSSLQEKTLPAGTVVFGEVGLSGELRIVRETGARLKEMEKHGFKRALVPPISGKPKSMVQIDSFDTLPALIKRLGW